MHVSFHSGSVLRLTDEGVRLLLTGGPCKLAVDRGGGFHQPSCPGGSNPCEGHGEICKTKKADAAFPKSIQFILPEASYGLHLMVT